MTTLHLGCGLDYRPGAINVDRYDLTVADLQAEVFQLPLPNGAVSHLEARHLVEHLGHAGTAYALAEWLRVLEPGGTLLIETPDRLSACRAAGELDPPAPVAHWLFGLPWEGYIHRTLFDQQELHSMLSQGRWANLQITSLETGLQQTIGRPASLCLTATRPADQLAELRAWLHIGFARAGLVDPLAAPPYLAHLENICDRIVMAVGGSPQQGAGACLATVLGTTARYDPRLTQVAVEVVTGGGFVSELDAKPFWLLAHSLAKEALPARMAARLRQSAGLAGTQSGRLKRLQDEVSLYLAARLYPQEVALAPSREWFEGESIRLEETDLEIDFFCPETINDLSRRETARGVRAFSRRLSETAGNHFTRAIAYDADNPLPVWNLARLALSQGRRLEALELYASLLELLPDATRLLRPELDVATERSMIDPGRFREPVQLQGGFGDAGPART